MQKGDQVAGVSYALYECPASGSCLVVTTSAINCLESPVSEMTYYVLSGTLNSTQWLICLYGHVSCPLDG